LFALNGHESKVEERKKLGKREREREREKAAAGGRERKQEKEKCV
jgi:hypothetical protein